MHVNLSPADHLAQMRITFSSSLYPSLTYDHLFSPQIINLGEEMSFNIPCRERCSCIHVERERERDVFVLQKW